MLKENKQNLFLEKRLVWMGGGEIAAPAEPAKPVEAKAAAEKKEEIKYTEKLDSQKMDEIADRVKKMNVSAKEISKPGKKGPATVLEFKAALKLAVAEDSKVLNVKNLDDFLFNGLMENLVAESTKVTTMSAWQKGQALDKFLKDKNVAKFSIVDGYWKFENKEGGAVTADYSLDTETKPVETAVLSSGVKTVKEADAAKEKAEKEAKVAEDERTDPKNLEKVKSSKPVPLGAKMTMAVFLQSLEGSVTQAAVGEKPAFTPITAAEMKEALKPYLDDYKLGSDEQNFTAFMQDVIKAGYKDCRIFKGRFAFSKGDEKVTSNPLDLSQNGVKDRMYAHTKLGEAKNAEAQKAATEKAEAVKPKNTPFDAAEKEAVKIITGKEEPDERDENKANIDARYLPAIKSILAYPLNGVPVDVKLPFNDRNPLDCKYYAAADGSYVLSWNNGKGFYPFKPSVKGEAGLKEAQRFFVANLNSGRIFQEVQRLVVNDKSMFEYWGQEVDDGPEKKDGGTYYEFDWKGSDPDVVIYTEPHGALRVVVEKGGIGIDGSDRYEFRAGSFQDMMRSIKRLQTWAESDDLAKGNLKAGEEDARFFEKVVGGARDFKNEAARRGAGKLLNVTSVNNMSHEGKYRTGVFDKGHYLDFDWMQKMVPPARLQMFRNGTGSFEYYLMPSRQKLGEAGGRGFTAERAMTKALILVAQQREMLMTQGGEKLQEKAFQDVLTGINNTVEGRMSAFVLPKNVKVEAGSSTGVTYLSMDGLSPVAFRLGSPGEPNMREFQRAAEQGYLVRGPALSIRQEVGETTVQPEFAAQRKDAVVSILTKDFEWNENAPNYKPVRDYLMYRVLPFMPPENVKQQEKIYDAAKTPLQPSPVTAYYQKLTWKLLAEWTNLPNIDQPQTAQFKAYLKANITLDNVMSKVKPVDFMGDNATKWPITNMYLACHLDTMAEMSHAFDTEKEFLAVEKNYKQQIVDLYRQTLADHPRRQKVSDGEYDAEIRAALGGKILRPDNFIKEYKGEGGRLSPEKRGAVPEQPKPTTAVRTSPLDSVPVGEIPLWAEKGVAVNNVLKPLKSFIGFQRVHTYVSQRLMYTGVEATDRKAQIAELEGKVWTILQEMTGVEGVPTDAKVQTAIMTKLKNPSETKKITEKYEVKDSQLDVKSFATTSMYLRGLLDSFADLQADSGLSLENFQKAVAQYQIEAVKLINEQIVDEKKTKKPSETQVRFDSRIMQIAKRRLILPKAFIEEYKAYQAKQAKYEKYQDQQKKQADQAKDYQERLVNFHQMSLGEMAGEKVGPMVGEALKLFKTVKSISLAEESPAKANVHFSRMEGNTLRAQNEACFNVKAGKAPGPILPMTVHVFREGGELQVSVADGWNNVNRGVISGAGPTAVDNALQRALDRHSGLNIDVLVRPEVKEAPVPVPADKPAAAPTTPAAKPVPVVEPAAPAAAPAAQPKVPPVAPVPAK